MMMNEFGTPIGYESEAMLPPGSIRPHERLIAESGAVNNLGGWIAAGVGVVSSLWSGSKQASAGKKAAQAQNDAAQRQHGYDIEAWEMNKKRLGDQWQNTQDSIATKEKNEERLAQYQDATAEQRYKYDMMIRNREQDSLNQQFARSNQLYNEQVSLNSRTAYAAQEDEHRRFREIELESALENNELYLEAIMSEGKIRARGASGRSASKASYAILAEGGRKQQALEDSILSGALNTRSALAEISKDKEAADLAAWAQKMLHPGTLPLPLVPFKTPRADFLYPKALEEYDFGPKPVVGAMASVSAAADAGWATALSGIAGTAGSIASGYFAKP